MKKSKHNPRYLLAPGWGKPRNFSGTLASATRAAQRMANKSGVSVQVLHKGPAKEGRFRYKHAAQVVPQKSNPRAGRRAIPRSWTRAQARVYKGKVQVKI